MKTVSLKELKIRQEELLSQKIRSWNVQMVFTAGTRTPFLRQNMPPYL
ncbi:MAG: hypothetical protein LUH15_05315 [Tannerellaceae bacterium]|nr:hypothetical protein [Tannerellaceae bacterium]